MAQLSRIAVRNVLAVVEKWRRASAWTRLLILSVVLYGVTFSILTALRVLALSALAYDLGVYHQAIYTTVFDARWFYYTADLPANPTGSIFGAHFSPILILLLVPYALVPSIFTLTIIQTWVLAVAAVPIYLLARRFLGSEQLAFALALAYLLHPATQGVNWYDFHPQAFLPLAMLSGLYFFERRAWSRFIFSMIVALSTIEMASFLVATIAVGCLAGEWWSSRRNGRRLDRSLALVLVGLLILAGAWAILGRLIVLAVNPQNVYYAGGSGYWSVLGASSLLDVPIRIVTSPGSALAALAFAAPLKAWYVVSLFAPVLFLPFRSLRAMVFCLPWLTVSLFSNQASFFLFGDQYPAFLLPFVFYGAVMGVARPWKIPGRVGRVLSQVRRAAGSSAFKPQGTAVIVVSTTIALLVVISPLGPFGFTVYQVGGWPIIGYHENAVGLLYQLIPKGASIITQSNLFPLVSDRSESFVVPLDNFYPPGTSFNETMSNLFGSVDHVLADFETGPTEAAILYSWTNRTIAFNVMATGDGAVLLGRGTPSTASFARYLRSFDERAVRIENGSLTPDPKADDAVAARQAGNGTGLWFGPFVQLPPGVYQISYRLRVDRPNSGAILQLPVFLYPLELAGTILVLETGTRLGFELRPTGAKLALALSEVRDVDIPQTGEYFWFTQTLVSRTLGTLEFPGLGAAPGADVWFDGLRIEQTTAFASADVIVSWTTRDWVSP